MKNRPRMPMDVDELRTGKQRAQVTDSRAVCGILQEQSPARVERGQFREVINQGVAPEFQRFVVRSREQDLFREHFAHLLREVQTIEEGRSSHRGKCELLFLWQFGIKPHVVHRTGGRKKSQEHAARNEFERAGIEVVWPQRIDDPRKAEAGVSAHQIVEERGAAAPVPDDEYRWRIEQNCLDTASDAQLLDHACGPTQEGTGEDDSDLRVVTRRDSAMPREGARKTG